MNPRPHYGECPCCWHRDLILRVVIHLIESHHWDFDKAMDWMRIQEDAA